MPDVLPGFGNDLITGTAVVDYLTGFYGNDTIRGGAGNDIIVEAIFTWPNSSLTLADGFQLHGGLTYDFGRDNDSIDGGVGFDILTYSDHRAGMVVDLAQGRVTTGAEVDRFVGIEALELGNGVDLVYANKAGFAVDLSDGNDRLIGMAGSSMYIGGDGNDTLDLSQFKTPVTVFLDAFSMRVWLNSAQVREFETVLGSLVSANMIYGGAENNLFRGGAFADELHGGFGVNTLYGASGNGGADMISAGSFSGEIDMGSGNDMLTFLLADSVDAKVWTGLGADRIHFVINSFDMHLDFMDFDPTLDHISGLGGDPLSLATSITQDATGVSVTLPWYTLGHIGYIDLRFEGFVLSDLSSSMFSAKDSG